MKKIFPIILFSLSILPLFSRIALASDTSCGETLRRCDCTDSAGNVSSITADTSLVDGNSCAARCNELRSTSYAFYCGESVYPQASGDVAYYVANLETPVDVQTTTQKQPTIPTLNVPIPGLDLSNSVSIDASGAVSSNMIGSYVNAVFSYGIVLSALLGVLMLTIAGFQYMTAGGDKGAVAKAKTRMSNVVFGLIILMATYSIAFMIDPRTTRFNALDLHYIDPVAYIEESGDSSGTGGSVGSTDLPSGISCDALGASSLRSIAYAASGKVNYRFGGKLGGRPPYTSEVKKDSSGRPYSEYCPENSLCLDCSGYADFLAQCAGLSSLGGSTAQIFSQNSEKVTSCAATSVNGVTLNPGDVLGWIAGTAGEKYGHIFTYIGNGEISDAHGSGRSNGSAVGIYSVTWACKNYGSALSVRRR